MGGGGLLGGVSKTLFGDGGAGAAKDAARVSADASLEATRESIAYQKEMQQKAEESSKPYTDLALSAFQQAFAQDIDKSTFDPNKLNQYLPQNAFNYQNFNGQQLGDIAGQYENQGLGNIANNYNIDSTQNQAQAFNPNIDVTQDPSYQFRLNQGINALDKSASARGMLLSGAQQKAINNYAQDTASQEYANAYNRSLVSNQQNNAVANQNFNQGLTANQQNLQNQLSVGEYNNQAANQNFNNQLAQQNQQYSQDLSSYQQNYNNALTGYNSEMNLGQQKYNQLASILGLGQTNSSNLMSANANYSNQFTNTQMQNAANISNANAFAANAKMQALQNNNQNLLGVGQLGVAAYGASDRRLKTNIKQIGVLPNGLNVYEYDYIWGEHAIGVMAQEVMAVIPDAVITMDNGYYAVDYSKIGE